MISKVQSERVQHTENLRYFKSKDFSKQKILQGIDLDLSTRSQLAVICAVGVLKVTMVAAMEPWMLQGEKVSSLGPDE